MKKARIMVGIVILLLIACLLIWKFVPLRFFGIDVNEIPITHGSR